MMHDYLLNFPSKEVAEQFGVANGFSTEVDGVIQTVFASHEYAIHEIGEHNGKDYWFLFRDLVGIPIPEDAAPFIYWASNQSIIDDAGDEIFFPRPEFNPDVPSVFWA